MRIKLRLEDYKHCFKPNQHENKINQLAKKKLDVNSLRNIRKYIIKNSNLILKLQ